jgi:hypothetical protein
MVADITSGLGVQLLKKTECLNAAKDDANITQRLWLG